MLCTDITIVNYGQNAGTLHPLRCKRWTCPQCAPINRQKVMHKAAEGRPNLFMTLTCNPGRYSCPNEAARDMKRGLVALRRRIERKWKVKNIPFVVVYEATKNGWPHMHLLLRAPFMHWKVLRAMWQEITGAFQVDVRFIKKASQVLFYVTKYIGKALHAFEGCKRWWRSHNYSQADKHEQKQWRVFSNVARERVALPDLVHSLASQGWWIERLDRRRVYVEPPVHYTRDRFSLHLLADAYRCRAPSTDGEGAW